MPSLRRLVALPLVALAACSGARPGADAPPALLDAWGGFDAAYAELAGLDTPCADTWGTWFEEFGARGVACVAAQVVSPTALVQRAGVKAFASGPHAVTATTFRLDLTSPRAFGHYDAAFVGWVVENGVVGEGRPDVRVLTQPLYDRSLRRLARMYWLTYADMAAEGFPSELPGGPLADYAAFLDGAPPPDEAAFDGGFSVFAFTERSERLLPRVGLSLDNEWEAKYEANTAYGFWLRRRADGTLPLWHDGLRRLLVTYDADWLAAER